MNNWPFGYGKCHCGCGKNTNKSRDNRRGYMAGEPVRYLHGHFRVGPGRIVDDRGYVSLRVPSHNRANKRGYVLEHVAIAERALGKPLPAGAVVHHVNGDKSDNRPGNLVICQDRKYHLLLHHRLRAWESSGHANWLKCQYCKQWDAPVNLYVQRKNGRTSARHRACHAKAELLALAKRNATRRIRMASKREAA